MYVCMYVCMYIRTYVCMHVRTYDCMYVCMYAWAMAHWHRVANFSAIQCWDISQLLTADNIQ